MTESEWLGCDDLQPMLRCLNKPGLCAGRPWRDWSLRDRRLRLFACACARQHWAQLHPEGQEGVRIAEQYADRTTTDQQRERAALALHEALKYHSHLMPDDWALLALHSAPAKVAIAQTLVWREMVPHRITAAILFDVVGNPFQPVKQLWQKSRRNSGKVVSHPCWLTPLIHSIAAAAYNERNVDGHLDTARLAVLSDALEEAGCGEIPILDHLRSPGVHVRGCWAVDLITGRT